MKPKIDPKKEQKWKAALAEAKQIKATMKLPQLQIAELALSVCEISWGGAKKEIKNNPFTMIKFAAQIGVSQKSLSNWVASYRNVYAKLPKHLKDKMQYVDVLHVAKQVDRDTPLETVVSKTEKYLAEDSYEYKVGHYLKSLKSLCFNFERNAAIYRIDEKMISEIKFYCKNILKNIAKDRKGVKGFDHHLANKYRPDGLSAARAVLGERKPVAVS